MANELYSPYEGNYEAPGDFRYQGRGAAGAPGNGYGYTGPEQFRPLTPWAYLGYGILFSIPLLGLIALGYYSLNDDNINRRSFARSYWCMALVAVGLLLLAGPFDLSVMSAGALPFL